MMYYFFGRIPLLRQLTDSRVGLCRGSVLPWARSTRPSLAPRSAGAGPYHPLRGPYPRGYSGFLAVATSSRSPKATLGTSSHFGYTGRLTRPYRYYPCRGRRSLPKDWAYWKCTRTGCMLRPLVRNPETLYHLIVVDCRLFK